MTELQKTLFKYKEDEYGDFIARLTPNIERKYIIGIRVPILRKIAKDYIHNKECSSFINQLPHQYYEENLIHSFVLSNISDFDIAIKEVNKFLPYVNNWAVSDTLRTKAFSKRYLDLIPYIKNWLTSNHTYTVRYGVDMLMTYFLDGDFKEEYFSWVLSISSDEYYVKMMIAWYFATALAKKWVITIPIIEERKLDKWVHNKSIQKALESNRITPDQKVYLKSLKIK